jgi:pyruvate,water dikinase
MLKTQNHQLTASEWNDSLFGDFLQPGEILVTATTNVGWTPLFPRAAAVVGCGNATMRLHTGDPVRVKGGEGIVEIIKVSSYGTVP